MGLLSMLRIGDRAPASRRRRRAFTPSLHPNTESLESRLVMSAAQVAAPVAAAVAEPRHHRRQPHELPDRRQRPARRPAPSPARWPACRSPPTSPTSPCNWCRTTPRRRRWSARSSTSSWRRSTSACWACTSTPARSAWRSPPPRAGACWATCSAASPGAASSGPASRLIPTAGQLTDLLGGLTDLLNGALNSRAGQAGGGGDSVCTGECEILELVARPAGPQPAGPERLAGRLRRRPGAGLRQRHRGAKGCSAACSAASAGSQVINLDLADITQLGTSGRELAGRRHAVPPRRGHADGPARPADPVAGTAEAVMRTARGGHDSLGRGRSHSPENLS